MQVLIAVEETVRGRRKQTSEARNTHCTSYRERGQTNDAWPRAVRQALNRNQRPSCTDSEAGEREDRVRGDGFGPAAVVVDMHVDHEPQHTLGDKPAQCCGGPMI